jgi:hypothetical protein
MNSLFIVEKYSWIKDKIDLTVLYTVIFLMLYTLYFSKSESSFYNHDLNISYKNISCVLNKIPWILFLFEFSWTLYY